MSWKNQLRSDSLLILEKPSQWTDNLSDTILKLKAGAFTPVFLSFCFKYGTG